MYLERVSTFLDKHKESFIVTLLGLVIFAGLNFLMLQMNYDTWTDTKFGPYTAFHKGWELSGFDNTTYIAVATWRPLYIMMRHPLIMFFIWPLYQINDLSRDMFGINCSIFVVAGVWTLISTVAWNVLYLILRRIIELPIVVSVLLNLFYFSFSHVMLATFAPDHMILSMTLMLITIYVSANAFKHGKRMAIWKSLLLCFASTGISTTNCVKIWLIDVCGMRENVCFGDFMWWKKIISRGMLYLVPLAFVGALYWYQETTIFAEEEGFAEKMDKDYSRKHPKEAAERKMRVEKVQKENEAKQISDSKLFQWTDFSLPLIPSVVENFFGEGIQLHDVYTLRDSHRNGHRPDIVAYSHWYNYFVELIVVFLFVIGIWAGRRERLLWMAFAVFCFDCFLHLGLRFALNDVYIMTAHWAFVMPLAIGYLYVRIKDKSFWRVGLIGTILALTIWLWYHNLSLTYDFILNAPKV